LRVDEEVSSAPGPAGRDNPVRRRAPSDRVASRRTGAAVKVCKDARVDKAAGRRV
jgi:hypothetical protein